MKETRVTVLPTDLKNEIDRLELTRIQKEKAYRLFELIFEKQFRDAHGYDSYVDLPQEYLRKVLGGGNYHLLLDKLKPAIIEVEGYFNAQGIFIECYSNSDGNGQSKRYRIKPKFLGSDFAPAIYQHRANEGENGQIKIASECFNKSIVYDNLSSLIINRPALIQRTKEHIDGICGENFKFDNDVKETYFKIKDLLSGYNGYTTLEVSLQRAKLNSVSLIKDKRKFILGDLQQYINQRKENTKFSYLRSIEKLSNPKCFYANRNPENNRLDHNLTSISSNLLEVIKADNDLCEIDMSNGQPLDFNYFLKQDQKDKGP